MTSPYAAEAEQIVTQWLVDNPLDVCEAARAVRRLQRVIAHALFSAEHRMRLHTLSDASARGYLTHRPTCASEQEVACTCGILTWLPDLKADDQTDDVLTVAWQLTHETLRTPRHREKT